MRYLIAFICPPLAVLLCGKPGKALLNLVLCFFVLVPGVIHALLVVNDTKAEKRNQKLIAAVARR